MGTDWVVLALVASSAFVATTALVPTVRKVAIRRSVIDLPGKGKAHQVVTPSMGGTAIVLVALIGSLLFPGPSLESGLILFAAVAIAAMGLVDDIRTLGPLPRVATEVVGATLVFAAGARVDLVGGLGDWALTVVWLVVLTNSFNLLDNMDGCAGLIASVTAAALVVAAGTEGQILVGGLAALLTGACVGFLVHNWHPARIFMGDAGSLFLGFMLATVALKLRFPVSHDHSIVAVILLAAPALFDTTLVVLSRLLARRPIYVGGTDHTSHRLAHLGLSTPVVSLILATGTAACCALGLLVGRGILPGTHVLVPLIAVGVLLLAALLRIPTYAHGAGRDYRMAMSNEPGVGTVDQLRVQPEGAP
jgi:UDP-GlcNAc:undecaprenyl-phosphate GlcNAc-1-phosphate transferase